MSEHDTDLVTDETDAVEASGDDTAETAAPSDLLPVGDVDVTEGTELSEADVPVLDHSSATEAGNLLPVGDLADDDTSDDTGSDDAESDAATADTGGEAGDDDATNYHPVVGVLKLIRAKP